MEMNPFAQWGPALAGAPAIGNLETYGTEGFILNN